MRSTTALNEVYYIFQTCVCVLTCYVQNSSSIDRALQSVSYECKALFTNLYTSTKSGTALLQYFSSLVSTVLFDIITDSQAPCEPPVYRAMVVFREKKEEKNKNKCSRPLLLLLLLPYHVSYYQISQCL